MLVSHFMLDLQDAYQRQAGDLLSDGWTDTPPGIHSGTLSFARGLGSLASHIDPVDSDPPEPDWPNAVEMDQRAPPSNAPVSGSFA